MPFSFDGDSFPRLSQKFTDDSGVGNAFFREIEYKANVILNGNIKNKWFLTENNAVVQFDIVLESARAYIIRGRPLKYSDNSFTNPFDSKYLDICISDGECSTFQEYDLKSIKCKLFVFYVMINLFTFLYFIHYNYDHNYYSKINVNQ